jgi:carbon storage regulator
LRSHRQGILFDLLRVIRTLEKVCYMRARISSLEFLRSEESAMLVLSRKPGESVMINRNVRVVVVEVRGDKVRLGIEAPKDVDVDRLEIFQRKLTNPETQIPPTPPQIRELGSGNIAEVI